MPPEDRDLVPVEAGVPDTAATLLRAAIEKGIDAEGIKTLAEVYKDMQRIRAEQDFNLDLAAFQAACPVIGKKKEIEFPTRGGGTFRARYAEMDTLIEDTRALRAQYGFSHSFDREVTATTITVWCILRHRGGHQTRTPFSVPLPKDGRLSEAHAVAGAVTFCERYAFRGALGLTTGPDRDGKEFVEDQARITDEQRHTLEALLEETQAATPQFWKYAGVAPGRLAELPAREFARVQQALFTAKARRAKEKTP